MDKLYTNNNYDNFVTREKQHSKAHHKNQNADVIHLMEKKYFSNRIRDLDKKKNNRYQTQENSEDFENNTIGLD